MTLCSCSYWSSSPPACSSSPTLSPSPSLSPPHSLSPSPSFSSSSSSFISPSSSTASSLPLPPSPSPPAGSTSLLGVLPEMGHSSPVSGTVRWGMRAGSDFSSGARSACWSSLSVGWSLWTCLSGSACLSGCPWTALSGVGLRVCWRVCWSEVLWEGLSEWCVLSCQGVLIK